jgi:hypothetical protein
MPRLREGFTVQKILFVEINLGQILPAQLHLNPTGCTGCIPTAIMIELKPEYLGSLQQGEVRFDLPAAPLRVEKTHTRHLPAPLGLRAGPGPCRLKWTTLHPNMFFKLMLE